MLISFGVAGDVSGHRAMRNLTAGVLGASLIVVSALPAALGETAPSPDTSGSEHVTGAGGGMAQDSKRRDRSVSSIVAPNEVYDGFADDMIRALGYGGARVLVIEENLGGNAAEAMALGRWIYLQGTTVRILHECHSACADVALASRDLRMAPDAVIGLHSWVLRGGLRDEVIDIRPQLAEELWVEDREYLNDVLGEAAAAEIYRLMRATAHDDILLLDAKALRRIGIPVTVE